MCCSIKKGEGTFSDVLEKNSLKEEKYYASKHMKQHFESIEQVNNLRQIQALRWLSLHPTVFIFQPLVLGSNELDHISKIHEVISTPGNNTPKVQAQPFRISIARMEKHPSPDKNFYRLRLEQDSAGKPLLLLLTLGLPKEEQISLTRTEQIHDPGFSGGSGVTKVTSRRQWYN
ncbi:LOW QUALITY PROTEIN: MAPK/MAK/MRK overlapping kinase [Sylvia borin]